MNAKTKNKCPFYKKNKCFIEENGVCSAKCKIIRKIINTPIKQLAIEWDLMKYKNYLKK